MGVELYRLLLVAPAGDPEKYGEPRLFLPQQDARDRENRAAPRTTGAEIIRADR